MQADRHELSQHVDLVNPVVDAIRNRDIDQPIHSPQWNSRLRPNGSQWKQAGSATATQNHRDDIPHDKLTAGNDKHQPTL
jgi:hypothetical protein